MTFDLVRIFHEMGLIARVIAGGLAVMAVASLAVFVERLWAFSRARRRSIVFGGIARALLERHEHQKLLERAGDFRGSPLAQMVRWGLTTYLRALERPGKVSAVELTRRDLERRAETQTNQLRRGLNVLATVGSIAPFVGLLGTVVGIIAAFQGISKEGSGGLGAVSTGISEALVETAFGLVVAIPAVLAFNYLNGRVETMLTANDQARGELIDALESHGPDHLHGEQRLKAVPAHEVLVGPS